MEMVKAYVVQDADAHFIRIEDDECEIRIPMSEDNPNEVKQAFNRLITRLKKGCIQIELQDVGEDLFAQVGKEYLGQLNREIVEVYGEMQHHGLCESDSTDDQPTEDSASMETSD